MMGVFPADSDLEMEPLVCWGGYGFVLGRNSSVHQGELVWVEMLRLSLLPFPAVFDLSWPKYLTCVVQP
jgi:hypothetical protein